MGGSGGGEAVPVGVHYRLGQVCLAKMPMAWQTWQKNPCHLSPSRSLSVQKCKNGKVVVGKKKGKIEGGGAWAGRGKVYAGNGRRRRLKGGR